MSQIPRCKFLVIFSIAFPQSLINQVEQLDDELDGEAQVSFIYNYDNSPPILFFKSEEISFYNEILKYTKGNVIIFEKINDSNNNIKQYLSLIDDYSGDKIIDSQTTHKYIDNILLIEKV